MPFRRARGLLAMIPRQFCLELACVALLACTPQYVTVAPEPLQEIVPIFVQVDPHLSTLTERWATASTSGEAAVGTLLRQVFIDDPQAPLRLTYITSQLDVTTVLSPMFYRPPMYQASYHLIVRVESPTSGMRQAWLQGTGEGRSWASAARATSDAITEAVRALCHQLSAAGGARASHGAGL
jgi:hypothetical protein